MCDPDRTFPKPVEFTVDIFPSKLLGFFCSLEVSGPFELSENARKIFPSISDTILDHFSKYQILALSQRTENIRNPKSFEFKWGFGARRDTRLYFSGVLRYFLGLFRYSNHIANFLNYGTKRCIILSKYRIPTCGIITSFWWLLWMLGTTSKVFLTLGWFSGHG